MKSIINLACRDLESEKKCIENEMPNNPVFVLDDEETKLCDYIDFLHDHYKLKNSILYQLKMCRNTALHGNVTVYIGKKTYRPHSIKDLLEILEPGTGATLVFENNEPKDLAEVLQQLIYINYPITELNLKLRKEFKDAERTEVFMKSLDKLFDAVATALSSLEHFQKEIDDGIRADNDKSVQKALDAYKQIQEKLQKARNIEMKVAVAASKKTGKSVLVNCMLEQELAPTSLETATPNSCIYKKSMDDKYHFTFGEITKTFTRP